jgi:hypothetical protein
MNGKALRPMVWLTWLALPLTALDYWRAWDQLPTRMAVHFDIKLATQRVDDAGRGSGPGFGHYGVPGRGLYDRRLCDR